jgi:hypothetical protein
MCYLYDTPYRHTTLPTRNVQRGYSKLPHRIRPVLIDTDAVCGRNYDNKVRSDSACQITADATATLLFDFTG